MSENANATTSDLTLRVGTFEGPFDLLLHLCLVGEQGVGARGDDAEDPACGREVLGREVEQPGGDLLKRAADPVVGGPAVVSKGDGAVRGHQPGSGRLGERCPDRRAVDLSGVRDPGDELAAVDAGAAGRGDGEHQPLTERDAGPGQQRIQEGAKGAFSLADDLRAQRRVVGHGSSCRIGPGRCSAASRGGSRISPCRAGESSRWRCQRWLCQTLSFVGDANKWLDSPA